MTKDRRNVYCHVQGELSSEEELIRKSSRGDSAAFEHLFRLKREKVFWVAFRIIGNEEDAKDITQVVFIKLWKVMGRFKFGYKLDRWLYRITVNTAIDFYRKEKRIKGREIEVGDLPVFRKDPEQEREMTLKEIQKIFLDLARLLTPRQRAVFTLKEIEGLSTREVAKIMKCRVSTVRNHLAQARGRMNRGLKVRYSGIRF